MDTKTLYKRVIITTPMTQQEFIAFFNDTVQVLNARYGAKYIAEESGSLLEIQTIDGPSGVRDIYTKCIADNIEYLKSGDKNKQNDFAINADSAYLTVWREKNKGKKVRKERW
jgi:hypothetical protein